MAIFGIGAYWDGRDVTADFLRLGVASVGWDEKDNPVAHWILRRIRTGDIIYIKSFSPSRGLTIKAVGVVTQDELRQVAPDLGWGVSVHWVWTSATPKELCVGRVDDKYPVRGVTLYEECNPKIQKKILILLLGGLLGS